MMKILNARKLAENLKRRADADLNACHIAGYSVLVYQAGQEIFRGHFGYRNFKDELPMCEGTLFRMASNTKPVTAAAALVQVAAGRLRLDDSVSRYLPAYGLLRVAHMENGRPVIGEKVHTPVTIEHLLTHTSGIGSGEMGDWYFSRCELTDLESMAAYYSDCPVSFEPGTAQQYSSFIAPDLAARLVEMTSGMPFDAFCQKYLFEPCEMPDTTFHPTDEQWKRMTEMHARTPDGKNAAADLGKHVFDGIPPTYFCGGAGLASTPEDYSHFFRMLCAGGVYNGRRVLPEELVREMGTAHVSPKIMLGSERWGLGVRVVAGGGNRLPVGCFGWSGAYGTHAWCDPLNKISAVYLKNSRFDGGAGCRTSADFERDVCAAMEE